MRRLTDGDLADIRGRTIQGYRVVAAKVKRGPFVDSDHYGVILGKNSREEYVIWEFYLKGGEAVSVCRGHYMTDREEAIRDYHARGVEGPQKFHVTVTETYQTTIEIEADSRQKAEQIVSTDWRKGEFDLGPECFAGVEFEVVPAAGNEGDGGIKNA